MFWAPRRQQFGAESRLRAHRERGGGSSWSRNLLRLVWLAPSARVSGAPRVVASWVSRSVRGSFQAVHVAAVPRPATLRTMTARVVFAAAAHAFVDLVERIPADQWDGPGLGVWTMRSLVGHTSSMLSDVILGLEQPADSESVTSAQGYYALAWTVDPAIYEKFAAAATAGAVQHGAMLGAEPLAAVRGLVEQALARVDDAADADLLTTAAGGMRLDNYLQTRTFELAAHSLDIASAAGLDHGVPKEVLGAAGALAAHVAALVGEGPAVLRALTGRAPLNPSFSIL